VEPFCPFYGPEMNTGANIGLFFLSLIAVFFSFYRIKLIGKWLPFVFWVMVVCCEGLSTSLRGLFLCFAVVGNHPNGEVAAGLIFAGPVGIVVFLFFFLDDFPFFAALLSSLFLMHQEGGFL